MGEPAVEKSENDAARVAARNRNKKWRGKKKKKERKGKEKKKKKKGDLEAALARLGPSSMR